MSPASRTVCAALLLVGCTAPPQRPGTGAPDPLQQADAALAAGDLAAAQRDLRAVAQSALSPRQATHYQLLRGELALARGDQAAALAALPTQTDDPRFGPQVLKLRAQILFAMDRPVAATAALVARARLLSDRQAIAANDEAIWQGLSAASLSPATLADLGGADRVTRGWIELAELARHHAGLQQLEAWRSRHPDHPGNEQLARLMMQPAVAGEAAILASAPSPGPGPTALLLPLRGRFATAAQMVRDGFAAVSLPAAAATVIDTGAGAADAYRQAESSGAGLVVGPLRKDDVVAVDALGSLPIPVLALNYLDSGDGVDAARAVPGLYQFGLAPDDETRQIVEQATARGQRRAVALVTADDRGSRILDAFTRQLQALGGTLVASATYPPDTVDFQTQVRQLLDIDDSYARFQALTQVLGTRPQFTPRRRRDIDFIFIVARPTAARLIWPMFRFYGAFDLPVYATSEVADSGPDPDLAGIRFCGAPWLVEQDASWQAAHQQIVQAAGGNLDLGRLYALGMDAARLAARLRQGPAIAGQTIPGDTGLLSFQPDGVIHRELACAELQADAVESLDAAPLPLP